MSAPAGWHLQPDGRERFWDGTQWTDQFRSPAPSDPTAGQAPAGYPQQGYAPGQPQTGYGAPGAAGYPPPVKSGNSGLAKGCLIAAVVILGLIAIVIAVFAFFASRVVDTVNETFPSGFPTSLPSGFPTELPTDLPSGLPTDLPSGLPTDIEQNIELDVGDGFELPRATIGGGWTLVPQGAGIPIVNIPGRRQRVPRAVHDALPRRWR